MPGSRCAFNTATALRRVFMPASLGNSHSVHLTRIFVPALLAQPQKSRAYWTDRGTFRSQSAPRTRFSIFDSDTNARHASGLAARRAERVQQREEADLDAPGPRVKSKLARLPRDDEIPYSYVFVKMRGEDGQETLSTPQPLKEVLAGLDRKTTSLVTVVLPDRENEEAPRYPICRIVNKREELARQKLEKERKKKETVKEKELELNWALAPHDLDHKLKTMQKFLAKGYKVQILLQRKANSKAMVTEKDANALVERIMEAMQKVTGSKECKGREGRVLGNYKLFLQGNVQDQAIRKTDDMAKETDRQSTEE